MNMNCFSLCTSADGNPGRSRHSITVHFANTSELKKLSFASFTARVLTLDSLFSCRYLLTVMLGFTRSPLKMADDGKQLALGDNVVSTVCSVDGGNTC